MKRSRVELTFVCSSSRLASSFGQEKGESTCTRVKVLRSCTSHFSGMTGLGGTERAASNCQANPTANASNVFQFFLILCKAVTGKAENRSLLIRYTMSASCFQSKTKTTAVRVTTSLSLTLIELLGAEEVCSTQQCLN